MKKDKYECDYYSSDYKKKKYVLYIRHVRCQLLKIENNKYNKKAEMEKVK